jgi:Holliday junction DNA helicase RuvB
MEEIKGLEFISLQETPEERTHDFNPKTFEEYLGQAILKEKLSVYTQAAKMRNEALDHMLLFGPPGLGKTTLSQIMAHVMSVNIKICSGPMMERTGDLVAILSSLGDRDILFIDEIHRMPTNVEEVLYSAMEHFRVDVIIGQGAGAKSVSLPIQSFTLIGATTKSGMISAPLRSRFGIVERLEYYSDQDLASIVLQTAEFLNMQLPEKAALRIGACARGTPRIAKKILRRVRDFVSVYAYPGLQARQATPDTVVKVLLADEKITDQALAFLGIDHDGLTTVDNMLLKKMIINFQGGPVGLETLAALIGEDAETIENVYEPFLMQKGYLEKTPRGRQIPHTRRPSLIKKFLGQETLL